jgi:hypothetical protein
MKVILSRANRTKDTASQAAEKVAVASRKRPSAAKAGPVFNRIRTG